MTVAELVQFCHPERKSCARPWSSGPFTYATNGHILIRVPRLADAPEGNQPLESRPGWTTCLAWFDVEPRCWVGIPEETRPNADDLDDSVDVGDLKFSRRYLRWLRALPSCQIGLNDAGDPARFRFDGGEGLLMPRRW